MRKLITIMLLGVGLQLWAYQAMAILKIEITKGIEAGVPIAIVPFGWQGEGKPPQDLAKIIGADLNRSGRFESLDKEDFLSRPYDQAGVKFKDWRLIKAEALAVGKVQRVGNDRYQVQFQLFDVFKGKQLAGYRYVIKAKQMRKVAHQISDIIYEKLTGEPGAFDTRIAYVTVEQRGSGQRRFLLQVADADGYDPVTVLDSGEPIMSPAWSPDGKQLAYVSFEKRRSMVYVQTLADGSRKRLADFRGLNSAPAWSPDGKRLALVLSRDGNPEIYILSPRSRQLRRLTHHHAIDTEPAWSPNGRHIVFTSDRSGKPQIYRISAGGGKPQRITFEGEYNARASYAADGQSITLVSATKGRYRIAVLHLRRNTMHVLTKATLDESPSFAPNGRMILYATEQGGRGVLAAVSADGRVKQVLRFLKGDVREPAWSPYNRKF